MISIQVKGVEKAGRAIFKKLDDLVSKVSRDAFAEAKRITPVQSGRAKKSWRLENKGKFSTEVVNRVPYAARLDEGYSKKAPRGITRPASKAVAKRYR
tara:strand:+ start:372 stop:665 length:294 start_codon:yes stop_codon:yes gene_type:complete